MKYGFLTPDDGGVEVFCHFRRFADDSRDHLNIGERVTFDVGTDERNGKSEARNVRVII